MIPTLEERRAEIAAAKERILWKRRMQQYEDFELPETKGITVSTLTMILPGLVRSAGPLLRDNVVEVVVPGEERPRLARVEPGHGFNAGDKIDLEIQLVPAEKIEVRQIAKAKTLGTYSTEIPVAKNILENLALAPTIKEADLPPGIRYVEHDPYYIMPEALRRYAQALEAMSRAGKYVRGQLIGPTGGGKTSLAYELAAMTKRPFFKLDTGSKTSPDEFLGHRSFRGGEDVFIPTAFYHALQTPRCVILADEFNRVHPSNRSSLFGLLDDTMEMWSDYLQLSIKVDPSIIFLASTNLGAQYTGTFMEDAAMESRLLYPIEVEYPAPAEESKIIEVRTGLPTAIARALVEFAGEIRTLADPSKNDALDRSISTRTLVAMGDLIAKGSMPPAEAIRQAILPRFSNEGGTASPRAKVAKVLQGKFGR